MTQWHRCIDDLNHKISSMQVRCRKNLCVVKFSFENSKFWIIYLTKTWRHINFCDKEFTKFRFVDLLSFFCFIENFVICVNISFFVNFIDHLFILLSFTLFCFDARNFYAKMRIVNKFRKFVDFYFLNKINIYRWNKRWIFRSQFQTIENYFDRFEIVN